MSAQLVVIVMPVKTPCCAIAVGPITPIPVACQTIGCPVCVVQFMAAPVWVVHEAVTGEDEEDGGGEASDGCEDVHDVDEVEALGGP